MNVVITGGNRGIGLALVSALLARNYNVYVTCRNSSDALNSTNATVISGVDVSKPESLEKALQPLKDVPIDWLINNAGVLGNESIRDWEPATIDYQFRVNALGPLLVTQILLSNLSEGGKIGLMTSRMGSMTDNGSGGYYGYRMSKAALNAAGVSLAHDLKAKGIAVALLHPGFVQTEMVNNAGDITPEQAASGLVQRLDELTLETTGQFFHSNGDVLPW
ncbi:SDR family oxidoreductase [Alteromonas sp. C1M14]|uniref:SDR family oxidoreductase n=1 Tax=Alteromonas sp. C1M14 TaxID=2841567 RepID=UPI001C08709A|nr:SDR family oxidoreductase [Alteromonas sp. C1M14]MBU2976980.1 SDR family oxidoreductase [Alteromonas sp. C1M14]